MWSFRKQPQSHISIFQHCKMNAFPFCRRRKLVPGEFELHESLLTSWHQDPCPCHADAQAKIWGCICCAHGHKFLFWQSWDKQLFFQRREAADPAWCCCKASLAGQNRSLLPDGHFSRGMGGIAALRGICSTPEVARPWLGLVQEEPSGKKHRWDHGGAQPTFPLTSSKNKLGCCQVQFCRLLGLEAFQHRYWDMQLQCPGPWGSISDWGLEAPPGCQQTTGVVDGVLDSLLASWDQWLCF